MPIDKIIPRFLVSDEDERLLKEGAMTDALNVTISEDGDGTEGVIKNVKGTTAADVKTGSELGTGLTVIGQLSDPQRQFIYLFVAGTSASDSAIYQYNTKSEINSGLAENTYREVAKGSGFGFDENGFVKANIVNGDFARNGSIQSIIYFTDNNNIPRKINVDRAIGGDYLLTASSTYLYSLSSMRATLNVPPTVRFDTDESITKNDFLNDYFQFATQLIYVDGEESSISPYSTLAVPSNVFNKTVETHGYSRIFQNVCVINPQYKRSVVTSDSNGFNTDQVATQPNTGIPDVESIRLLARRGTTGSFFIVDDLPVSSNISREVYGETRTVWNYTDGEYRFYNDVIKSFIDPSIVDKMYDNVPQKAQGQAIAGDRLIYSNYVEGYANGDSNGDPVKGKISVKYLPPGQTLGTAALGKVADEGGTLSNGDIVFDIKNQVSWPNGSTASDIVDAGSRISVSFVFNPSAAVTGTTTDGIVSLTLFDDTAGFASFTAGLCPSNQSDSFQVGYDGSSQLDLNLFVSADLTVEEDTTLSDVALQFKDVLSTKEASFSYSYADNLGSVNLRVTGVGDSNQTLGTSLPLTSADISVTYAFDDITDSSVTDGQFIIKPYIKSIIFKNIFISGGYSGGYIQDLLSEEQIQALHTMNFSTDPLSQDDQSFTVSNTTDYVLNSLVNVSTAASYSTFKAGCSHDFGVVYYDKWNRSGFVNEIGSVHVKPLSQRASGEEGRAEIKVTMDCDPPPWAAKWQLVYGGMSSFSDYFQYTAGGGYVPTEYNNQHDPDEDNKEVYVSLKTLDIYREEKSSNRNYSFTEGDILRVVSYVDNSGSVIYPSSNDPTKPIEFNVVRTEVLGASDNPIRLTGTANADAADELQGTFLVLTAPEVTSNVQILDSTGTTTGLKYDGFDWYSVSKSLDFNNSLNAQYPDSSTPSPNNYWGQQCVIEILTPSKSTDQKVYYEIGEAHDIWTVGNNPDRYQQYSTKHGPSVTTRAGDTWQRLVACKTPMLADAANNDWDMSDTTGDGAIRDLDNWDYLDLELECLQVEDFSYVKDWSKGRAHTVFKEAASNNFRHGLVYGDAYVEGNKKLSYTSFNPSFGNFENLDGSFGKLEYIGNYNDDLVAIQENKLCLIPVNKNILEYASGSADVAVSTNVLGQRRYSAGDYGTGGHPEAVIIQDNNVYFVDESRQAVCSLTGGQLVPISEKGMSSFFEGFFASGADKYVSGYDPRDNTYYITRLGSNEDTVGYDAARGVWQSRYSFTPDVYANQNNMLYSANYTSANNIFWKHDSSTYNRFYGSTSPSTVQVVSKLSPSRVKVFNAISYEGDSGNWDMNPGMETSLGQTSGLIEQWSEKEGSYYASTPRNANTSGDYGSTTEEFFVGVLTIDNGSTYQSTKNLSRILLPSASEVGGVKVNGTTNTILAVDRANNKIYFASNLDANDIGQECTISVTTTLSKTTEDVMRGHWAKITLTNSSSAKHELYCINTHITDSKSHHPLGG